MELKDLVGEHLLTGVDFGVIPPNKKDYQYESSNTMTFVLDGRAYCAIEDPSDGYRSCLRDITEVPMEMVKNTFAPCKVLARHRTQGRYSGTDDILECLDVVTGKTVLEVGTDNADDYYPSYVANFSPEHMAVNAVAAPVEEAQSPQFAREESK